MCPVNYGHYTSGAKYVDMYRLLCVTPHYKNFLPNYSEEYQCCSTTNRKMYNTYQYISETENLNLDYYF
jgi:hypothetical protein